MLRNVIVSSLLSIVLNWIVYRYRVKKSEKQMEKRLGQAMRESERVIQEITQVGRVKLRDK